MEGGVRLGRPDTVLPALQNMAWWELPAQLDMLWNISCASSAGGKAAMRSGAGSVAGTAVSLAISLEDKL